MTTWGGPETLLMGVLNVTPDSFSDGGECVDPAAAVARARAMIASGARIIDIGGESSRPGALPVDAAEEIGRVVPVIAALRQAALPADVRLSIDTTKAAVARAALAAGADLINDIGGFRDPALVALAVETGAPVIAMHMRGTPQTMQQGDLSSPDIVREVADWLGERARLLVAAGVSPAAICLDPGIGFGKTVAQNLALLARLDEIVALGYPVLVGASRKSFLGAVTGRPVDQRVFATAAACACAVWQGARILRVHDVAEMADVAQVVDAIRAGRSAA